MEAGDVGKCSLVADGSAKLISFDAETAHDQPVRLTGISSLPDGPGPFPAVVILPGSTTLITPGCYRSAVERFVNWGFATMIAVPTTARDDRGRRLFEYSFADLGRYALGAARALVRMENVDPTRLVLWGHSRGGQAVLDAVSRPDLKPNAFRAAVAAAPVCPAKTVQPTIPLLVMIGTRDTDVPVKWCTDYAENMALSDDFEFLLLPDAGHSYWARKAPDYNPSVARLADHRLKTFLTNNLSPLP